MVDRLQSAHAQPIGELVGVDAVALVLRLAPTSHIADHNALGVIDQQIVQPLRVRPLLEGHVHARAGALDQRQDRLRLGATIAFITIFAFASRKLATTVAL
jgi:hypothetical protein